MELSNATLTTIVGHQAAGADLTITINRLDLEDVMIGTATLADNAKDGKARLEGNVQILARLASTISKFRPLFEILPRTKETADSPVVKKALLLDDAPAGVNTD